MLLQRERVARRAVNYALCHHFPEQVVHSYRGAETEAHNAAELARRLLNPIAK